MDIDKEIKLYSDLEDNPTYLKQIINFMAKILDYPDVSIYKEHLPDGSVKIIASLEIIKDEIRMDYITDYYILKHNGEDVTDLIIEDLLKSIGYEYIKRAYNKRKEEKYTIPNFRTCNTFKKTVEKIIGERNYATNN